MPIEILTIPNFYATRLATARWVRSGSRYRTRIYISALRKCRFVPLDDAQRIAVDHLLCSWGFTNWDAVKSMNASVTSSCGYTFYVSKEEFDKRYDPLLPRTLPPHLLRHILSFNHKSVRTHCL